MKIRRATMTDLDLVTAIEAACFPPAEAAPRAKFEARLKVFPEYFWIVEQENTENEVNGEPKTVGFINGAVINQKIIDDEMYADATCHKVDGEWQTVFGINTLSQYRGQGIGRMMLEEVVRCAREEGRKGCVLTCKDYLLPFYESVGFRSMGPSASTHGGAKWNDMIIEF